MNELGADTYCRAYLSRGAGSASGRVLLRDQTQPSGHVSRFLELLSIPAAARSAVAPSGPIPGIVISLRLRSLFAAAASSSRLI